MSGLARLSFRFVNTVIKPGKYCDGGGLWLRVRAGNTGATRSWEYRWMLDGESHTMGLGSLDKLPLVKARELAKEYRERRHEDPRKVREEKRRPHGTGPTLGALLDEYIEAKKPEWTALYTEGRWRRDLRLHVFPVRINRNL